MVTPHSEQEVPVNALVVLYKKIFGTNQDGILVLLDDPGRVRSQITSVVCQIQQFDFGCNLVVTRTIIMGIPPVLGINPLYAHALGPKTTKIAPYGLYSSIWLS
jgi:hypothetical protein